MFPFLSCTLVIMESKLWSAIDNLLINYVSECGEDGNPTRRQALCLAFINKIVTDRDLLINASKSLDQIMLSIINTNKDVIRECDTHLSENDDDNTLHSIIAQNKPAFTLLLPMLPIAHTRKHLYNSVARYMRKGANVPIKQVVSTFVRQASTYVVTQLCTILETLQWIKQ